MKIFKPFALGVLQRPIEFRRRFFLSVAALSFCPMGERPALLGDIAMWKFLADELPPTQPLDLCIPKTAAEFLVTGSAHAPGGRPVQALSVTARLGAVTKRLGVVGDRHIEDGVPTQPLPFSEMPLGWDRAYGGKKVAANPLGRGVDEVPVQGLGHRVLLPNIVLPEDAARRSAPEPLNFGPLDIAWPQRQRFAGTHDQRWLEEEFPGFARDTDWRVFMAAAPDQHFNGMLAGGEEYAFTNLHPQEPELTGRLPGIQPRIMILRRGSARLEEIPLSLTTVWFFPARKRMVLIHHGRTEVGEEDGRDVLRLIIGADKAGAPRPVQAFHEVMQRRLDPDTGPLAALKDSDLVPEDLIVPDPEMETERKLAEEEGLLRKRARARQVLEHERERARLAALGLDPDAYAPPLPPEEAPPTLERLPAMMEEANARMEAAKRDTKTFTDARMAELTEATAAAGVPPPDLEAKHRGPPLFSAASKRAEFEAAAAELEAAGADSSVIRGILGDPASMKLWADAEEGQRAGYLASADGQLPAHARTAADSAALRARLLDGRRNGRRLDLCGADLRGMDLSGFDLSEAWLDGADLSAANLTGAVLRKAVLAHARLEGARLAKADLSGANLGRAVFGPADLSDVLLREAILRHCDLRGARLHRADLREADLGGINLEGADLTEAQAQGAAFHEASLARVVAVRAALDNAVFSKAELTAAVFTTASLRKAAFIAAAAEGVDFSSAEMAGAVFVENSSLRGARFAGARCAGVNFRATRLDGAVFDGAVLDECDFSDAILAGASLDRVSARQARFVVADLRGARLTRSDLAGASLARADIRGADLSDTSFFEGDFARIHADQDTRYDRVMRTRVRLHPRRTAP